MAMSMSMLKPTVDGPRSIVDGPPPTVDGERPATSEKTDIASDAPPEESGSPSAAQASETAVHGPRSLLPGNSGPWNLLLLLVCFWSFVGSGHWAALRGSQLSPSQEEHHAERDDYSEEHHAERDDYQEEHHAERDDCSEEHHAERDDYLEEHHAERDDYSEEHHAERDGKPIQTGERPPTRGEPAARNEATAIGSDSAESSGRVGSALTRQSGRLILGGVVGFTNSERPKDGLTAWWG